MSTLAADLWTLSSQVLIPSYDNKFKGKMAACNYHKIVQKLNHEKGNRFKGTYRLWREMLDVKFKNFFFAKHKLLENNHKTNYKT